MEENKIYNIKGQDYIENGKLFNRKIIIDKLNGFGNNYHSVTYLNKDDSINYNTRKCILNIERIILPL